MDMAYLVSGTSHLDIIDALNENNDCLKLLVETLETSETDCPDGFNTLLTSVVATYGVIAKNLNSMLKQ